jgi:hypothetical protein
MAIQRPGLVQIPWLLRGLDWFRSNGYTGAWTGSDPISIFATASRPVLRSIPKGPGQKAVHIFPSMNLGIIPPLHNSSSRRGDQLRRQKTFKL